MRREEGVALVVQHCSAQGAARKNGRHLESAN
jgi:hypothetical protein